MIWSLQNGEHEDDNDNNNFQSIALRRANAAGKKQTSLDKGEGIK